MGEDYLNLYEFCYKMACKDVLDEIDDHETVSYSKQALAKLFGMISGRAHRFYDAAFDDDDD